LRALADVRIGEIVVHDFRIIQEPSRRAWVSVPQLEYRLHDSGERYYKPLIVIPKELRDRISEIVIAEFERVYRPQGDGVPIGGRDGGQTVEAA